jgi:TPR repeat protein
MYSGVSGVPKNYSETFKWFSRAAEQGDDGAQFFLGDAFNGMYAKEGLPISRNSVVAAQWYRKAAFQGHAFAQL